jgi:hypothetical protein
MLKLTVWSKSESAFIKYDKNIKQKSSISDKKNLSTEMVA